MCTIARTIWNLIYHCHQPFLYSTIANGNPVFSIVSTVIHPSSSISHTTAKEPFDIRKSASPDQVSLSINVSIISPNLISIHHLHRVFSFRRYLKRRIFKRQAHIHNKLRSVLRIQFRRIDTDDSSRSWLIVPVEFVADRDLIISFFIEIIAFGIFFSCECISVLN